MAIGISVGLISLLLGASAFALKKSKGSEAVSASHSAEQIYENSQIFREQYEIDTAYTDEVYPPISSSDASRPATSDDYRRRKFPRGTGAFVAGTALGVKTTADVLGSGSFNWGLLIGIIGGAFVAYKVVNK